MSNKDNDSNSKEIVLFENHVIDMKVEIPDKPESAHKGTCTRVKNAWVNFSHMDDKGNIWVDAERLSDILRTSKAIAKHTVVNIDDKDILRSGNKIYIRAYEIRNIIDKFIQNEKVCKRKDYLKYSEQIYMAIRDCDSAEVLRTRHNEKLEDARKKLKHKRIKKYNIEYDELTGERLIKKTAEFSHIRSFAIYTEIGADIENGLIVNKETHKIITNKSICDEVELYNLCLDEGWNIDWYNRYKNYYNI